MSRWLKSSVVIIVVMFMGLDLPRPEYATKANNGKDISDYAPPQPTKLAGCVINVDLQDRDCTPGAVMADVTVEQLCTLGYAKSVRDVTAQTKREVYDAYGIDYHSKGEYQVDHLISLELGGSNDIANLWPQPASPLPGYREKDRFENYLHDQICVGKLKLAKAQEDLATNWALAYKRAGL